MQDKIVEILHHPRLNLDVSGAEREAVKRISQFISAWEKWNSQINLTSESSADIFLSKHIFDSLLYAKAVGPEHSVIDIGSGAGLPGIPLKIIYPDIQLVLVESQRKKANFLRNVIRSLELSNAEVVNDRAENLAGNPDYSRRFDRVLFKAVGDLEECLNLGAPFLGEGGRILIKKAADFSIEKFPGIRKSFSLIDSLPLQGFSGSPSNLMVFERCST